LNSLAGYLATPTSTAQARGSTQQTGVRNIARRVKHAMILCTSRQNGHREAIFVFDCYNRRMGLPTTQTARQASRKYQHQMKYQNGYRRDRDTR
jgi:hypothetical protein